MRICFFTENHYKGGVDSFLINLFNCWPRRDDELTLVCNDSHPGFQTIESKTRRPVTLRKYRYLFTTNIALGNGNSHFLRSLPVRAAFVILFRLLQYPLIFPWYVFTLRKFFAASGFDRLMVVNGGYPASFLCRCAPIAWKLAGKRPLAVFNFHNLASKAPRFLRTIENVIDKLVCESSSFIVGVSKACLDTLADRQAFHDCGKLKVIHNGIEDPVLTLNSEEQSHICKGGGSDYCLMLATYQRNKGHAYLLTAFQSVALEFPELHLHICGYGRPHEKTRVAKCVQSLALGNCVSLHDFCDNPGLLIKNAKVLLVPSQAFESFGLTIVEAMAWGTPVVATDVGGIPEVIGNSGAGYVCSRANPQEFAQAIKRILRSPSLASELGRNGRRTFEHRFAARMMSSHYESLINTTT